MVKKYSLKVDGDKNLSANFKVREFRCKDGSDKILIADETVGILQSVRNYFGRPVIINSAYRTPSHNAAVNGAKNSQHVKGTACDIVVEGVPPAAVAAFIEKFFPNTGCGLYSTFVHVDTRGYKSRWKDIDYYVVVTSFNLGNFYENYKKEEEEEKVGIEEFTALMDQYLKNLGIESVSDWAKADWNAAIEKGITDGTRPRQFATREEVVSLIERANGGL